MCVRKVAAPKYTEKQTTTPKQQPKPTSKQQPEPKMSPKISQAWHPASTSRTTSFEGVLATGRGEAATAVWHGGAVVPPFWGNLGDSKSFQIFLLLPRRSC